MNARIEAGGNWYLQTKYEGKVPSIGTVNVVEGETLVLGNADAGEVIFVAASSNDVRLLAPLPTSAQSSQGEGLKISRLKDEERRESPQETVVFPKEGAWIALYQEGSDDFLRITAKKQVEPDL